MHLTYGEAGMHRLNTDGEPTGRLAIRHQEICVLADLIADLDGFIARLPAASQWAWTLRQVRLELRHDLGRPAPG